MKLDEFLAPTVIIRKQIVNANSKNVKKPRIGVQIKETKDEKSLRHHQKYLEHWDKYEKYVQDHFEEQ